MKGMVDPLLLACAVLAVGIGCVALFAGELRLRFVKLEGNWARAVGGIVMLLGLLSIGLQLCASH